MNTVSDNPVIQARYEAMLRDGVSPRLADMLANQQPPRGKDNTSWLAANSHAIGGGDLGATRNHHEALARDAGVSTGGKIYMPDLAKFSGDPRAWVADHSEYKNRLEARGDGWSDGTQSVQPRNDVAPAPNIDIADDLVEERALAMIQDNPGLLHKHAHIDQKGDVQLSGELLHEAKESCKPDIERGL
jgi:hypothetical protein